MRHEIAPDLPAGIGKAEVQQQPRCFHAARAQEHGVAALTQALATAIVDHRRHMSAAVALQIDHPAFRAHLGTMRHGERQPARIRAGLGGDAATLVAGAAIDARLPDAPLRLSAVLRHQRSRRIDRHNAQLRAAARHRVGGRIAQHGRQFVTPRRVPGIAGRTRHADAPLDCLDIMGQFGMRDRPVLAVATERAQPKVPRIGARAEGAPMQRRSADAHAAVVGAERGGVGTAAQPFLHPVNVGRQLVGDMLVRTKGATGFQHDDRDARLCQPRRQRCAAGSAADDHDVDRIIAGPDGSTHARVPASCCQGSIVSAAART